MTDPVCRCSVHGFVTAPGASATGGKSSECLECGRGVERVLSGERRRRLSTFVSGALRHFPGDTGLSLDESGWADYDALASAVVRKYDWAESDHLAAVVVTDPKGRFEEASGRIRAAYGHSVDVELDAGESEADGEKDGMVAVHAVVDERDVFETINELKSVGASGILVTEIERLVE